MMARNLNENWWVFVVQGICAVFFGIAAVAWPGLTLSFLVLFFGASAFVSGVSTFLAAVTSLRGTGYAESAFFEGALGIVIGVLAFRLPGVTALTLLFLIAIWAMVTGLFQIMIGIRLRKEITGEWLLIAGGLLSLLFGGLLIINPGVGALAMVFWIGVYAIVSGVLLMSTGFSLHSRARRTGLHTMPHPV